MKIQPVEYVWMDGKFVKWDEAKVHVMTHALHYGTGVFEGIRAYPSNGNLYVFRLKDHIERLINSAKIYMMDVNYTVEELTEVILELLRINKLKELCYIRPIVFKGLGEFGLNPFGSPTQIAICAFPVGAYLEKGGVSVCTSSWRRTPDVSMPSAAKACGSYLNSVLAKIEAVQNGYDEAIFIDINGYLSEGAGENIFIVKKGVIYTPPVSSSILEGITRDSIIKIISELGYPFFERPILRSELYVCDEAFFTGTAAEITPILKVDNRIVGNGKPGKITNEIKNFFFEIISCKKPKYQHWLTKVY
jgi:branched-chain amino acid aminotransferase